MNKENRLNYAWQKVRLTIPNMMALYNMYKPATLDKWEQVVYNNIDINPILDSLEEYAEVSTDDAREWINKHIIEDTFNGGQMQEKAIQIIENEGYEASIATEDEDKKDTVHMVNAVGTENIAAACKDLDCKMMYISTDYVFDGQGTEAWQPDCKDYKPLNV